MNLNLLGYALAHMANGEYLRIDRKATGGFDQWITAQGRDARSDYQKLVGGCLDFEAARRKWAKVEAFVAAHIDQMSQAKPGNFAGDVDDLVWSITYAFKAAGDNTKFDPYCQRCGDDVVLDWGTHYCVDEDVYDEDLDLTDAWGE